MSEKTEICSKCGHEQEYDPEMIASQQSDPDVARMILNGTLNIHRCDQCGAEAGFFFSHGLLTSGYGGLIIYVQPSAIDQEGFLRALNQCKVGHIQDPIYWVFSLDELCYQTKLRIKIRDLQNADNRDSHKFEGGG